MVQTAASNVSCKVYTDRASCTTSHQTRLLPVVQSLGYNSTIRSTILQNVVNTVHTVYRAAQDTPLVNGTPAPQDFKQSSTTAWLKGPHSRAARWGTGWGGLRLRPILPHEDEQLPQQYAVLQAHPDRPGLLVLALQCHAGTCSAASSGTLRSTWSAAGAGTSSAQWAAANRHMQRAKRCCQQLQAMRRH